MNLDRKDGGMTGEWVCEGLRFGVARLELVTNIRRRFGGETDGVSAECSISI